MRAAFHPALVFTFLACSLPMVASGQSPSSDSLVQRIVFLELKTVELERRVLELEALLKATPPHAAPARASGNWREVAHWRRLRRGMTMDQVRTILGEPDKVEVIATVTTWKWGEFPNGANIYFRDDRVAGWTEPDL